jgi:hypothetical protein
MKMQEDQEVYLVLLAGLLLEDGNVTLEALHLQQVLHLRFVSLPQVLS